jgi:hypothetical protein
MNTNAASRGHKEKAMNKSLIAIASATVALAAFASSSAEAGFGIHFGGHHGFFGGGFHGFHRHCRRPEYVIRQVQPRVYVTRQARPVVVTEDEPAKEVVVAHNENSTIAMASADVADNATTDSVEKIIVKTDKTAVAAPKPDKVAEAVVEAAKPQPSKRLDCKKFFPSVGLTLTVPCE